MAVADYTYTFRALAAARIPSISHKCLGEVLVAAVVAGRSARVIENATAGGVVGGGHEVGLGVRLQMGCEHHAEQEQRRHKTAHPGCRG